MPCGLPAMCYLSRICPPLWTTRRREKRTRRRRTRRTRRTTQRKRRKKECNRPRIERCVLRLSGGSIHLGGGGKGHTPKGGGMSGTFPHPPRRRREASGGHPGVGSVDACILLTVGWERNRSLEGAWDGCLRFARLGDRGH